MVGQTNKIKQLIGFGQESFQLVICRPRIHWLTEGAIVIDNQAYSFDLFSHSLDRLCIYYFNGYMAISF